MSTIILYVDEARRTLTAEGAGGVFVKNDKNVNTVRFALLSGFADIVLDEHTAVRVMYIRPGETEVRAKTLTFYEENGINVFYDWTLQAADLEEKGILMVSLCILRIGSEVEEWHTTPYQIRVLGSIHTDDSDEGDETITPTVAQRVAVLESMIQRVASGAPVVVDSASDMTDTGKLYVLSTDGNWYYHNGSTWVAGGVYGGVPTDTTLTQSGMAADAESTGNAIVEIKSDLSGTTRNLCNSKVFRKGSVSVVNGVVSGTASAFSSAFSSSSGGVPVGITWEENTQYTLSFLAKNNTGGASSNGLTIYFGYTDGTSSGMSVPNNITEYSKRKITSSTGKTISRLTIGYASQGSHVWELKDIQIEKGSDATNYVPPITAVDYYARERLDTALPEIETAVGENTAQNKKYNIWNYINFSRASVTKNGVTAVVDDGVLTVSGKSTVAGTYFDLYSGNISGTGLVVGKTYYIDTGLHGREVDGSFNIYTNNGTSNVKRLEAGKGIEKLTIPADTQTIIIRYFPPNTNSVSVNHKLTFTERLPIELLDNVAEMRFLRAWGTGDCTIIKFKNGENLVIDFGLNEAQGTLQSSWQTAISQMGITHIDFAIISHYHGDHVGMLLNGISSLLDENTTFFTAAPYTSEDLEGLTWMDEQANNNVVSTYTAVTQILETAGVKRVYPTENAVYVIGNAKVQFWNTDHREWLDMYIAHTMYDYNHCSLCNYLTIGRERIAFTGDIGSYVMEKYKTSVLPSQILKANHHSAGYAVNSIFFNSVMPDLVITMLGHALGTMKNNSPNQTWCEANSVPNVVTGINDRTLILEVSSDSYKWLNSVRRCIVADEEALAGS